MRKKLSNNAQTQNSAADSSIPKQIFMCSQNSLSTQPDPTFYAVYHPSIQTSSTQILTTVSYIRCNDMNWVAHTQVCMCNS